MRGLVRVGAAVPSLALGNVKENMKRHLAMMREAKEKHVSIVTFPELSLTGYTCGDLFFQRRLLDDVTDALLALKDEMPEGILAVVGAPLEIEGALYNCAVVLEETWKMIGKIDGYFFLGDGVDDFAQAENFIRRRDPDALMLDVRGNNDFCCPNAPYYRVTDFGGVRLYLTHGHLERVKLTRSFLYERAREEKCDIAFYGHTHEPDMVTGVPMLVNPGAVCREQMAMLEVEDGRPRVKMLVF